MVNQLRTLLYTGFTRMSSKISNRSQKIATITAKFNNLCLILTERTTRIWCAVEAQAYGRGGIQAVYEAVGIARTTIIRGMKELKQQPDIANNLNTLRSRRRGGGRKTILDKYPNLLEDLNKLIEPATRGDPETPLRWSSKSTLKLAKELQIIGYNVTQPTVYSILKMQGYSMKSNRKSQEGKANHEDRDAQFNFINNQTKEFQDAGLPVLSVDTKKKENLGNFKNNGKEWSPKGEHTEVLTHDFPDKELGKVAPHGIYDINNNKGFVSIGISSDTAEFAVNSIRSWYSKMGQDQYTGAKKIMITADCGGSNNYRSRLWKSELQELSNELDIEISVCHFPPGTSKWNKIEHRLFAQISQNWRGIPLVTLQTVVELIGNTTTATGLTVKVVVDKNTYEIGRKISNDDFAKINIEKNVFHGEWNYVIKPQLKLQ